MPFLSSLDLRAVDRGGWVLLASLTYRTHRLPGLLNGIKITVPTGFHTDLASIPAPFRTWFEVNGPHRRASVVHDYLYRRGIGTREAADRIFREAMQDCGVSWWRRWTMWSAVRIGGWAAWRGN